MARSDVKIRGVSKDEWRQQEARMSENGIRHRTLRRISMRSSGPRSSTSSRRLGFLFRGRRFHRAHVEIEQAFALVALLLVLLAQLDDFLENLHIEPFALGLGKDFLFLLVQLLQFAVDVLNPLDERTNLAAGNGDVRHGASL